MASFWRPFASYNLWLQFAPPIGQEHLHCEMKRGFAKARAKEPQIAELLTQDTTPQRIGILAQRGVYECHHDPQFLSRTDAIEHLAQTLQLHQESPPVRSRVMDILKRYYETPILLGKNIIQLSRGDEGVPKPILLQQGGYQFNLYAAFDCIYAEPDGTLHVLDFKTGKSNFDLRQAYIYLLAASYLYPQRSIVASFYNLEAGKQSTQIAATAQTLEAFRIELALIAQRHEQELKSYRQNPAAFQQIYSLNPGFVCRYCQFNSICQFVNPEIIA